MKITISGDKGLAKFITNAKRLDLVRDVVKSNSAKMDRAAKRKAVFVKGYSTGATKRSIMTNIENGGLSSRTKAGTDYSGYPEKGTRFMDAQPFMQPALNEVKEGFLGDLRKVMK